MSKRRKRLVIILIILTVIYFLLIGASYFFIKLFIAPAFEPGDRVTAAYPYSNAAIPDDFAEHAAAGLKLYAPDSLDTIYESAELCKYLSPDASQCDLEIIATTEMNGGAEELKWMREENPHLFVKWLTGCGWLTKLGMKIIGYEIPQSDHEMIYLLEKMDPLDYNKFSLIETYANMKLVILKSIMIPAFMGTGYDKEHPLETPLNVEECAYFLEADSWNAIIHQRRSDGGRYQLTATCYPDSDDEKVRTLLVQSDDPKLAQTVIASCIKSNFSAFP